MMKRLSPSSVDSNRNVLHDALLGYVRRTQPYQHFVSVEHELPERIVMRLREELSALPVRGIARYGLDKAYRMRGVNIDSLDLPQSPTWHYLAECARSPEYRERLEELTGVSLGAASVETTAWRQRSGCFLSGHTDKDDKIVTHVLFLAPPFWPSEWGGCLRVLRSCEVDDYAYEIPFRPGAGVILIRSDNSWHGYERIAAAATETRDSIQISFHSRAKTYSNAI